MLFRRLADLVVVLHFLTALFFFFGGVLAIFQNWLALFHLPLALWVSIAFIMGWTCPLTPLENSLRKVAGEQGYEGSFIDQYIGPFLGFQPSRGEDPTQLKKLRRGEVILGVAFCLFTMVPYGVNYGEFYQLIDPPQQKPPDTVAAPHSVSEGKQSAVAK